MNTSEQKIALLESRVALLHKSLKCCTLCPRNCQVNRIEGEEGICKAKNTCIVYSSFLHHGEEPLISGEQGSGTIFFAGCNLNCIYCQNYKFSHTLTGNTVSSSELAKIFIDLEAKGAHNINLVTPTHFLTQIFEALIIAFNGGLSIPLVYNTSGYESIETLKLLDGIVDIYLADARYAQKELAEELSLAKDYPQINKDALIEMHKQVGDSIVRNDILQQGMIVRHLILPNCLKNSKAILRWLKENLEFTYISIMAQYQPYHRAASSEKINRKINEEEYNEIKEFTDELGITKGWFQDFVADEDMAGIHFDRPLK